MATWIELRNLEGPEPTVSRMINLDMVQAIEIENSRHSDKASIAYTFSDETASWERFDTLEECRARFQSLRALLNSRQ